jgi:hypothetical protein
VESGDDAASSQIPALMKDVTRAALQARALDPENVYPVDVGQRSTVAGMPLSTAPTSKRKRWMLGVAISRR